MVLSGIDEEPGSIERLFLTTTINPTPPRLPSVVQLSADIMTSVDQPSTRSPPDFNFWDTVVFKVRRHGSHITRANEHLSTG